MFDFLRAPHGPSSFFILYIHTSESALPLWLHFLSIFSQLPDLPSLFLLIFTCMVDSSIWSCAIDCTRVQLYSWTSSPKLNSPAGFLMSENDATINELAQSRNLGNIQVFLMPLFSFLNLHFKTTTNPDQFYFIKISWIYLFLSIQQHPLKSSPLSYLSRFNSEPTAVGLQ